MRWEMVSISPTDDASAHKHHTARFVIRMFDQKHLSGYVMNATLVPMVVVVLSAVPLVSARKQLSPQAPDIVLLCMTPRYFRRLLLR
jgi:hypothetical protein